MIWVHHHLDGTFVIFEINTHSARDLSYQEDPMPNHFCLPRKLEYQYMFGLPEGAREICKVSGFEHPFSTYICSQVQISVWFYAKEKPQNDKATTLTPIFFLCVPCILVLALSNRDYSRLYEVHCFF